MPRIVVLEDGLILSLALLNDCRWKSKLSCLLERRYLWFGRTKDSSFKHWHAIRHNCFRFLEGEGNAGVRHRAIGD